MSPAPKDTAVTIDPKTAKVNLATLVSILAVAIGGAFAWANLESTVGTTNEELGEVKQALDKNTEAINRGTLADTRLNAKVDQHEKKLVDHEARLRRLENGK